MIYRTDLIVIREGLCSALQNYLDKNEDGLHVNLYSLQVSLKFKAQNVPCNNYKRIMKVTGKHLHFYCQIFLSAITSIC